MKGNNMLRATAFHVASIWKAVIERFRRWYAEADVWMATKDFENGDISLWEFQRELDLYASRIKRLESLK